MFKDITHYKSKRKGRRGPIPLEGKREPAGRLSRSAYGGEYMVYFIAFEDSPRIKVGRTKNLLQRIKSYRHGSGTEPFCLAQLVVENAADSASLETTAIHFLQARYERMGREWFAIPEHELAQAICEIVNRSGIAVKMRGAPGTSYSGSTDFLDGIADAYRHIKYHSKSTAA